MHLIDGFSGMKYATSSMHSQNKTYVLSECMHTHFFSYMHTYLRLSQHIIYVQVYASMVWASKTFCCCCSIIYGQICWVAGNELSFLSHVHTYYLYCMYIGLYRDMCRFMYTCTQMASRLLVCSNPPTLLPSFPSL